ncbi:chitobiase/beta-hexosaminidase C-terminal domain-containing protein [Rheinheimera sp. SA_1]|uniref:chitobiase/beta-hexosaminidase C-terminal domain-containing protein n=1 Tax=Rheinheimera sp. SA_1 TaxID=1827365 RepID=UPI0018D41F7E|nr:chitobiase/beta-hexosaminidase C-terminal domain-containing protein [Rheinheimera sp. SA_1]
MQSPSEINIPAYFHWDIRNVKECYSMTSGTGAPALKTISGVSGPATNSFPYTGSSRWYCIDLNGNRYPANPDQFIEAKRIVEAPLTAPELTKPAGIYNTGLRVTVIQQPGITYRYSLNGSEVNQYAPVLNAPLTINSTATLRVRAYRAGFNPGPETIATYTIVGSPKVQRFEWVPQTVDIYNSSYFYWDIRNVKECYSTTSGVGIPELKPVNGTYGPFVNAVPISGSSKWYCIDLNGNRLPTDPTKFLDAPRVVESPLTAPQLTPAAGAYSASVQVSVLSQPNLTYRYTINGDAVTSGSPAFSNPVTISSLTNLRVKAFRDGFNPSPETNVFYNIILVPVAAPEINPSGGAFSTPVSVALKPKTAGAQTRYTTNGSDVTASSNLYSTPFMVTVNTTVKARSFKSGMADSALSSANFVITPPKIVTYKYDALGRLTEVTDAINGNRLYRYDAAGNRIDVSVVNH